METTSSNTIDSTMTAENIPESSQALDIETLYNSITPQAPQAPSIAKWLVPILDHHKNRIISLTKNSELGRLSAERLTKDLEEGKYPSYIQDIPTPIAREEYPGLQEKWNNIFKEYKSGLTQ